MAPVAVPSLNRLVVRDDSFDDPTTRYLVLTFGILLILGCVALIGLFVLRLVHRRRAAASAAAAQDVESMSEKAHTRSHRRSRHPPSISIENEKAMLMAADASRPSSPVPEIRITFPDEESTAGKRQSGRVVVVRISDKGGVGLEPYHDEAPPTHQTEDVGRLQSLDLERIGGLTEKERP